MAGTGVTPSPQILPFAFNRELLDGKANVHLELNARDPQLLQALMNNQVPRPDQPLVVAAADFHIEQDRVVPFSSGNVKVGFSAGAGAKLAIFSRPGQLRDGIVDGGDLAESIEQALNFDNGSNQPFLLLRLTYDVSGTASGAVALGAAGSLTFSANAGRKGLYAIIRQPSAQDTFLDSMHSLVGGVRLPRQVNTADDLAPGTWIIAETDASVALNAGVKFGYDFSWIRETQLGTLTGDIGLKLAAGISANLGFSAAGKYAVLMSRESPDPQKKVLRLRIYKLRMREFDFAFQAQATVTPVATVLPDNFDDLLRGILGTHSSQVMSLLGKFDDWTQPDAPIFGPFVGLVDSEARKIIQKVTGVQDLNAEFAKAKGIVQKLFETWHRLPADAASRVAGLIGQDAALAKVRDIAGHIAQADDAALQDLVAEQLQDVAFLQSPEGQIIEKLALNGLFSVLNNAVLLAKLRENASFLTSLLDGSTLQNALTALQQEVASRLKLTQIEDAVNSADLNKLDAWLRARLETFLEDKLVGTEGVAKLKALRDNLRSIREKFPVLYQKALDALHRNYTFSLNATYRNTSTSEALIDVEFDFAAAGSLAPQLLPVALQGRFDDVLSAPRPGVTIRQGSLTHAIRRESNVVISLPFFSRQTTHTNDALASLSAVEQSGGRLFYLKGEDIVATRNQYTASLTITMQLAQRGVKSDVLVHSTDTATYQQSIDRAFFRESASDLVQYAAPFVNPLFTGDFGTSDFAGWVGETFGANAQLGKALLSLDVTLPPEACMAWLQAPGDRKSPTYQRLSVQMQKSFKQLVHDTFFESVDAYQDVSVESPAFAVMVFSSIPPCTKASLDDGGQLTLTTSDDKGSLYWNHPDPDLRRAMAGAAASPGILLQRMETARRRLQAAGDPDKVIGFYKDSQASTIVRIAQDSRVFISLLFVESLLVNKVVEAALDMAEFQATQLSDPAKARRALAEFGADVTNAFNARLRTVAGDAVLPLGALMFMQAAQILDSTFNGRASAMLSIIDVKDTIPFPPLNFPNHDPVAPGDIVRAETLVHRAGA